uniref:Uncharacterized protein n=1 Tax=Anas platyrhynchos platyrhynchos TaxID=8840 RepID=A0A493T570_ANAPP
MNEQNGRSMLLGSLWGSQKSECHSARSISVVLLCKGRVSSNVNSPAPSCLQARKYVDQIWLWGRLWKDLNRTKEKGNFSLGPTQHRKNSPPEQNSRALILTYIVEREDLTLETWLLHYLQF